MRKGLLLTCTSLMLALPSVASAANNDIPFFDGSKNSMLKSDELQLSGNLLRPGSGYKSTEFAYKADLHYPAVYNGSFNWGNPRENLVQNEDKSDPYVRISNDGYINSSVIVGDRMVTEVQQVTKTVVKDKYWGEPNFVLGNLKKHDIKRLDGPNVTLGKFYWIRDIAYLSGGYAGAGGVNGVNRYSLWYVRTSKPEIKDLKATSGKKMCLLNLHLTVLSM